MPPVPYTVTDCSKPPELLNGRYLEELVDDYLLTAEVRYLCDIKLPQGRELERSIVCEKDNWNERARCPRGELKCKLKFMLNKSLYSW